MSQKAVNEIYVTMKKLHVFTRDELEYKLFSEKQDPQVVCYIDELLNSPIVRQVFEFFLFVGY